MKIVSGAAIRPNSKARFAIAVTHPAPPAYYGGDGGNRRKKSRRQQIMCNGFRCNNWWWIIILLLIFGNGNTCGCDNGCGCDNNNCGCGNNWWWIIILALLGAFGENGLGCGCDNNSCGCGNNNTCGCGCLTENKTLISRTRDYIKPPCELRCRRIMPCARRNPCSADK